MQAGGIAVLSFVQQVKTEKNKKTDNKYVLFKTMFKFVGEKLNKISFTKK